MRSAHRGSTVPRQCASHCRCRLPSPASKRSSWQQSNVACRRRTPPEALEGCQEGRSALDHLPYWITRAKRPGALLGALPAMCLQQCRGECVAEAGRAAPAQRAAAQAVVPAPGGGRVYRALHSPCGPVAHIALALALPWCESTTRAHARCFTFPLLNLLGGLEAAWRAGFSL